MAETMSRFADLIIALSYFSIPLQILASLWKYPRMASMPIKIVILLVLFALFIFLCGTLHLMHFTGQADTHTFLVFNVLTAIVSMMTAVYLLPLIPNLLESLEKSLTDLVKLNRETAESKNKLFTFMAFLCHEIRNPLFAITSYANFLGDTNLTDEQEDGVGSILDSSMLMLRLVNDVLDISKIDAGKLELEQRYFDLHRLLSSLESNMRLQILQQSKQRLEGDGGADERSFPTETELIIRVAPDVPKVIFADSIRILQIFFNLLSNASKFTSHGVIQMAVDVCDLKTAEESGVRVAGSGTQLLDSASSHNSTATPQQFTMALLDDVEGGLGSSSSRVTGQSTTIRIEDHRKVVVLSIEVSDTGVGIPPDRLETIFEPYSQAKLSDFRKHGGTGLGLSILANLTKLMGGTIKVKSTVGQGSTFRLLIPVRVSDDPSQSDIFLEGNDASMSDPMLTCRRLPVYQTPPNGLNGQTNGSHPSSTPSPSTSKTKERVTLTKFNFPPNSRKVLVTDDNQVNRKIIGKMLAFFDIEYEFAVHGQDALNILQTSRNVTGNSNDPYFALVLMDLYMPVMDGYEAIKTIREQKIDVPVVALTANALTQERIRALELGADEFQTKPILRDELHAVCSRYLPLKPVSSMESSVRLSHNYQSFRPIC
jgi:signal transduction histidine kinase/CheY-like chemotaxis protein